jgi:glycolate oxidase iron-sulfur subunit
LSAGAPLPVVHTAELLDWATGGPIPPALAGLAAFAAEPAPGSTTTAPTP